MFRTRRIMLLQRKGTEPVFISGIWSYVFLFLADKKLELHFT
jgi:hypothetical protein